MRRRIWLATSGILVIGGVAGCQGGGLASRRRPPDEPALVAGDKDGVLVAGRPARPAPPEFVGRHPLLAKPREVYENSGNNTIVKVAGATLVGVPMGIFGELRQIIRGTPPVAPGYTSSSVGPTRN